MKRKPFILGLAKFHEHASAARISRKRYLEQQKSLRMRTYTGLSLTLHDTRNVHAKNRVVLPMRVRSYVKLVNCNLALVCNEMQITAHLIADKNITVTLSYNLLNLCSDIIILRN